MYQLAIEQGISFVQLQCEADNIPRDILDVASLIQDIPHMRLLAILNLNCPFLPPLFALGNLFQV